MPKVQTIANGVKPYLFLGLDLQAVHGNQWRGECPFCQEEKFHVNEETTLWDCKTCVKEGNLTTFLRELHEAAGEGTTNDEYEELGENRGVTAHSLKRWGLVVSPMTREWLIPCFNKGGLVSQVYVYRQVPGTDRMACQPCPKGKEDKGENAHDLWGCHLYDPKKPECHLLEGVWDAIAYWQQLSKTSTEYTPWKKGKSKQLLSRVNIFATPSANVYLDKWNYYFKGKKARLLYDNDWPRVRCVGCKKSYPNSSQEEVKETCPKCGEVGKPPIGPPSGYEGMKKALTGMFAGNKPESAEVLMWGDGGYTTEFPHRYDIRDYLNNLPLENRADGIRKLWKLMKPVTKEWLDELPVRSAGITKENIQPVACSDWRVLKTAWMKAMRWRPEMGDILAVMLAVALSTDQVGDQQLFLKVIGDAGSGKTRFCDAMAVSKKYCKVLEHLTGFHSGYVGKKGDEGKDFSLISRINKKTLITPEGDVMISAPNFLEVMSQQRRIFDGKSSATYKNQPEEKEYNGLRTPWIIAGTPAMFNTDQAKLGDRFMTIWWNQPPEEEKREIIKTVIRNALRAVRTEMEDHKDKTIDAKMRTAYELTGGYVNHLRENAGRIIRNVAVDEDELERRVMILAEFVADMRASPSLDTRKDIQATKELPSRFAHQLVRLGVCVAGVLQKPSVDDRVYEILRKVAIDSSKGRSLEVVKFLYQQGPKGYTSGGLCRITENTATRNIELLRFLKKLNILELFQPTKRSTGGISEHKKWRLTERTVDIMEQVFPDLEVRSK